MREQQQIEFHAALFDSAFHTPAGLHWSWQASAISDRFLSQYYYSVLSPILTAPEFDSPGYQDRYVRGHAQLANGWLVWFQIFDGGRDARGRPGRLLIPSLFCERGKAAHPLELQWVFQHPLFRFVKENSASLPLPEQFSPLTAIEEASIEITQPNAQSVICTTSKLAQLSFSDAIHECYSDLQLQSWSLVELPSSRRIEATLTRSAEPPEIPVERLSTDVENYSNERIDKPVTLEPIIPSEPESAPAINIEHVPIGNSSSDRHRLGKRIGLISFAASVLFATILMFPSSDPPPLPPLKHGTDYTNNPLTPPPSVLDLLTSDDIEAVQNGLGELLNLPLVEVAELAKELTAYKQRLVPMISDSASNSQLSSAQRLSARGLLAFLAPEHESWDADANCQDVVNQLIELPPQSSSTLQRLFQPVSPKLRGFLESRLEAEGTTAGAKSRCCVLLLSFDPDNEDLLARFAIEAPRPISPELMAAFQRKKAVVVPQLEALLRRPLVAEWPVVQVGDSPVISDEIKSKIESAKGQIHETFAFVAALPVAEFSAVAQTLRSSHYCPIRMRPWRDGKQIFLSVLWNRDGRNSKLERISENAIKELNGNGVRDNWLLEDIVRFPNDTGVPEYVALWCERKNIEEQRRFATDMTVEEIGQTVTQMANVGMNSLQSLSGMTVADQTRLTGVWSNIGPTSNVSVDSTAKFRLDKPCVEFQYFTDAQATKTDAPVASDTESRLLTASLFQNDNKHEYFSISLPMDPGELLPSFQNGYRIRSLSVFKTQSTDALVQFVLYRPVISTERKILDAKKKADIGVELLRLDALQSLTPLLINQKDPTAGSYLLTRLDHPGIDPQAWLDQAMHESDPSVQRMLILGIGHFAAAKRLTDEQIRQMKRFLLEHYSASNAGVHHAIEWTLRKVGADSEVDQANQILSASGAPNGRNWYVTKTDSSFAQGIEMIVLPNEGVSIVGSPISDEERQGGPLSQIEQRHEAFLNRRLAISSCEITVSQFRAFRSNYMEAEGPTDLPAHTVSWQDAVAFCNWLSEREGLPPDQWCYRLTSKSKLEIEANFRARTGYRLPTEDEWEFACRAGTDTPRYYGYSTELLNEYGWRMVASKSKRLNSVGRLKPNAFGLFDCYGNVAEWCHDEYERVEDTQSEDSVELDIKKKRAFRGGDFSSAAESLRSASRRGARPTQRSNKIGFRVARTMPAEND